MRGKEQSDPVGRSLVKRLCCTVDLAFVASLRMLQSEAAFRLLDTLLKVSSVSEGGVGGGGGELNVNVTFKVS